jgi:glucosamine--fructose-6-phosphate aminotransferase (isomerizing)
VVNLKNTHPHTDEKKSAFMVHNGIIENYRELQKEITGTKFYGNTDTEVAAKLLATITGDNFLERVEQLITRLE